MKSFNISCVFIKNEKISHSYVVMGELLETHFQKWFHYDHSEIQLHLLL